MKIESESAFQKRELKIGERIKMPDKYKHGIEDPNDKFEIQHVRIYFGKHRFQQYKNGEPMRSIFALDDLEFLELSPAVE